jgi:DNA-binding transcriptional regulator YdaS (Cro superfamily)
MQGMDGIKKAIALTGNVSKLAAALGVTPQAVCFWRDGLRVIRADLCPRIERMTDGAVRCEDLRPDVDWAYLRATDCQHLNQD